MARNAVRIGWVPMMSRARSIIKIPPALTATPAWAHRDSASTAPGRAELLNHSLHQIGRRRRRTRELVFKFHGIPFERAQLVKRLHLDPLDILHGRDKSCDAINVCRIVR